MLNSSLCSAQTLNRKDNSGINPSYMEVSMMDATDLI